MCTNKISIENYLFAAYYNHIYTYIYTHVYIYISMMNRFSFWKTELYNKQYDQGCNKHLEF